MRRIVTEWFRLPAAWRPLAEVLGRLGRPVTVWSGPQGRPGSPLRKNPVGAGPDSWQARQSRESGSQSVVDLWKVSGDLSQLATARAPTHNSPKAELNGTIFRLQCLQSRASAACVRSSGR